MAYTKQTWVDGTTPIDAEHLNHMENGIANAVANVMLVDVGTAFESEEERDAFLDKVDNGTIPIGLLDGGTSHSYARSPTPGVAFAFYFYDIRDVNLPDPITGEQFTWRCFCIVTEYVRATSGLESYPWYQSVNPIFRIPPLFDE